MEVRQISFSKKISVELSFKVDTIEGEKLEIPFTIPAIDGSEYHGKLDFEILNNEASFLEFCIYNVKLDKLTMNLIKPFLGVLRIVPGPIFMRIGHEPEQNRSLEVNFEVTFEPLEGKLVEENITNAFRTSMLRGRTRGNHPGSLPICRQISYSTIDQGLRRLFCKQDRHRKCA